MKTYEVEGTLITVVEANDGAEAIRKVEEKQTHGEMLNMSAIEVESPKEEFFREISEFAAEFKRLEKKYSVVLDTTYVPDVFEQIISVKMDMDKFFNMLSDYKIDVKEGFGGTPLDLYSTIHNGIEYHTFVKKVER